MKTLIIVLSLLIAVPTIAQKKASYSEYNEVVEAAKKELNEAMKGPEGNLFLLKEEYGICGTYTMDIQIHEKGKVASVFCKSREGEIKHQTMVKDFVKAFKFNFKMPKGKKYKFEFIFNFNN